MHVDGASAAAEPSNRFSASAATLVGRCRRRARGVEPLLASVVDIFALALKVAFRLAYVTIDDRLAGQRAVDCLQGQYVDDRYLEASQQRTRAAARASRTTPSAAASLTRGAAVYGTDRGRPTAGAAGPPRFCRILPRHAAGGARGRVCADDLGVGRVDLIALRVGALLLARRAQIGARLVLLQPRTPATAVCCDGGAARWLRPDERTIALALRRALRGEGDGSGWSVQPFDGVESALRALVAADGCAAAAPRAPPGAHR